MGAAAASGATARHGGYIDGGGAARSSRRSCGWAGGGWEVRDDARAAVQRWLSSLDAHEETM